MANWNERDQQQRGGQGWRRETGGARSSFGEQRFDPDQGGSYNTGDFGRNDHREGQGGSYGQGGYGRGGQTGYGRQGGYGGFDEDRSWQASGDNDWRPEDGYNDAGPLQRGGEVGQDEHRYGGRHGYQGGSYDAQRGGSYQSRQGARGPFGGGRDTGFGDPNPYVQAATDGERQGGHRGRGPSDYRRSDDRIREDVNDRLTEDDHIDASGIQVQVQDGEVTLNGTVDSRFAKRHAEDLADGISGAKHVQNNLRVSEGGTTRSDTSSSPTTARGSSTLS